MLKCHGDLTFRYKVISEKQFNRGTEIVSSWPSALDTSKAKIPIVSMKQQTTVLDLKRRKILKIFTIITSNY